MFIFKYIFIRIIKGINFWIVDKKIRMNKELDFKIEINQIWNGTIPNFIKILKIIKILKLFNNILEKKNLIKKIIEAHLWIRKYFIEFSISIFSLYEKIGKNLNMFNSRLNHIKNLELTLIDIIIENKIKK